MSGDEGKVTYESTPMSLDVEANLLSSLMWVPEDDETVNTVFDNLKAEDFLNPAYAEIFRIMNRLREEGKAFDPATMFAFMRKDRLFDDLAFDAKKVLTDLMTLKSRTPGSIGWYTERIIGESYRRQFITMAEGLVQAGYEAPEEDLFDIMVERGKEQRNSRRRLDRIRKELKKG